MPDTRHSGDIERPVSGFLPFSERQFFEIFAAYNNAIWPIQIIAYAAGISAVVILRRTVWRAQVRPLSVVSLVLAAMWLWTGVAYHWLFFTQVNPAAAIFGVMFVLEATALAYSGVAKPEILFGRPSTMEGAVGASLIVYALFIYPLIGVWSGHSYPATPVFGVTPCPVTLFTFGVLLWTRGRVPWVVVALPLIWSLIGGSAAILLDVVQDWILLASGVIATILFARRRVAGERSLDGRP